jgi:hypothetical protein
MKPKQCSGSVVFTHSMPLKPWARAAERYVAEITGKIVVWRGNDEDALGGTVGQMTMLVIKMAEALRNKIQLFEVLDSHGLDSLYSVVFEQDGVYRPDVEVEAHYGDLLIVEDIQLKPQFESTDLRNQAVETAIATFATAGVVLIRKRVLRIEAERWVDRGYIELPDDDYLLRDNWRLHN